MRELQDSAALVDDPVRLRERFDADGVLLLRHAVDEHLVEAVREAVLLILADHGCTPEEIDWSTANERHFACMADLQRVEVFHALAHEEALLAVARALFGADAFARPLKALRVVWPDVAAMTTPPHQDLGYNRGTVHAMAAWVPLTECPAQVGGLSVMVGSHRRGLLETKAYPSVIQFGVSVSDDDPAWATAEYSPGDVVIFHSLTIHGSVPNRSEHVRLSVDCRYQSASQPIARPSLMPFGHQHGKVPDWSELLAGVTWDSEKWLAVPPNLHVVEFNDPNWQTAAGVSVPSPMV